MQIMQCNYVNNVQSCIVMEGFVREAIALAKASKEKGNHPFGAILVVDDEVVCRAENTVVTERDCTGHAETNLMRKASKLTKEQLSKAWLVTSTEPCVMCTGATYWAGVRKIAYSFPEDGLRELTGADNAENATLLLPCSQVLEMASIRDQFEIVGPILAEEGKAVHGDVWEQYK